MILECGRVVRAEVERHAIGILKREFPGSEVWCDKHGGFEPVKVRNPTAAQIVGIQTLPIPEECPF